jgi:hypothetical protein
MPATARIRFFMMMVLGESGWALQGPVVGRKQGTPWMLKVTQFDRVARDVAAPEARLGRCNGRFLATVNRN